MSIRLIQFMDRNGIKNQTELAQKLGVSQSAISSWSSGRNEPDLNCMKKMLLMGMTIAELFGEDAEQSVINGLKNKITPRSVDDAVFLEAVKKALAALGKN